MGTTIFMLFLNCFADVERRQATLLESNKKISPENCASFINKMFFGWFMGFAWRANKKPIKDDEVYDLNSRFTSGKLCERLDGDCKCNQKTKSEKVYAGFLINQFVIVNQLLFFLAIHCLANISNSFNEIVLYVRTEIVFGALVFYMPADIKVSSNITVFGF